MSQPHLDEKLAALSTMSAAQLRREWEQVFRESAPVAFGIDLLARGLAYHLQEQAYGGLSPAAEKLLRDALKQAECGVERSPRRSFRAGTRLVRDWDGDTHHVEVVEGGYLYDDRCYTSLSAVAGVITGTKWSGPRFFGLAGTKLAGASREPA